MDHDGEYTAKDGTRYTVEFKSYAAQAEIADRQMAAYVDALREAGWVELFPGCLSQEVPADD